MSSKEKSFVYKGQTHDGKRHGVGQYNYPGGIFTYIGPWVDGVKHGEQGRFSFPGYFEHEGVFTDGEMTGPGKRTWADGRYYEGQWLRGAMNGHGKWTNTITNESYKGEFNDNRRHGYGTLHLRNDDVYCGVFDSHKYHGLGSFERPNEYNIEGYFTSGYVDSIAKIHWNGIAKYDGAINRGHVTDGAEGAFEASDGSYSYIGPFSNGVASSTARSLTARLDRVAVLRAEQAALEAAEALAAASAAAADPKKKDAGKKPAAAGKGAKEVELPANIAKLNPGGELGVVHISLGYETTPEALPIDAVIAITQPIELPSIAQCKAPAELRRRVVVELVPYTPPVEAAPAGGKGGKDKGPAPTATSAPPAEVIVSNPVPLWHRLPSLAEFTQEWSRFPYNAIKFIDGTCNVDSTCKFNLTLQGEADNETSKAEAKSETSDVDGVKAFKVDCNSVMECTMSLSKLKPESKAIRRLENSEIFSIVVDFCLDIASITSEMVHDSEILIPIVQTSIKSTNQESQQDESCQVGLFLRAPTSATPVSVDWSNGIFELRYCLSGHPLDLVDSSCSVACASWLGGLSVPDHWHSVGVNIVKTSKTKRTVDDSKATVTEDPEAKEDASAPASPTFAYDEEEINYDVELFVDGVQRELACDSPVSPVHGATDQAGVTDADMRSEVASRWLKELGFINASVSENNSEAAESTPLNNDKILNIAFGSSQFSSNQKNVWFSGRIGSVVICNRDSACDLSECTGSFASWVKLKLASVERAEARKGTEISGSDAGSDATATVSASSALPQDCSEVLSIDVICRGGYGMCSGIILPSNIPEGMYALMVKDGTDQKCRSDRDVSSSVVAAATDAVPQSTTTTEAELNVSPGDMGTACKCIPAFPYSKALVIQVAAKAAV